MYKAYNKKFLIKLLCLIGVTVGLMKATGGVAGVVFPLVALAVMQSANKVYLFFIFLLMISSQVVNGYFIPKTWPLVLSIRGTLLVFALLMASRLFGRRNSPLVRPFAGMMFYLVWEMAISGQGFAPMISYLKLILFSLVYLAYYAITNEVVLNVRTDSRMVRAVVLSFAVLFILGSILVIPFPGISLMTYEDIQNTVYIESLFKGMTTHSQSMGPLVAAINVIVLGDLLFSVKKVEKLYLALLVACPILVYKSGSRTALGTYVVGSMVLLYMFMRARGVGSRWKGKILSAVWLVVVVAMIAVLAVPSTREKAMRFALKMGEVDAEVRASDLSFENITSSRKGVADACMENFRKKPLWGNGFQVGAHMVGEHRQGFWSYLSAPIEKGVWTAAVLEEGGVVGFVLFASFLLYVFFALWKRHAYIAASCFFTMTLSNMGEFTFFSMSYTGGLIWALVFAGVVLDAQRMKDLRINQQWMSGRLRVGG